MKTRYLLALFLCLTQFSWAQNKGLELSLGPNLSAHEAKSFDNLGIGLSGRINYMFGKKIGLALDAGSLSNVQNIDFELPTFDFETQGNDLNSAWNMHYLSLGPLLRLGNKFHIDFSPQLGIGNINAPESELFFINSVTNTREQLLAQGKTSEKKLDLIHNLGLKMGYQFSNRLGVHLNANLLGSTLSGNSFFTNKRVFTDHDNSGTISEQEALAGDLVQDLCNYSPLSFSGGLTYSFGKKRPKVKRTNTNNSPISCSPPKLISPLNNESFAAAAGVYPEFRWRAKSQRSIKNYRFQIIDNDNKIIYSQKVTTTKLKSNKKIKSVLAEKGDGNFKWKVHTNYGNCQSDDSEIRSFSVANGVNRGECNYVFTNDFNLECDVPAYDSQGNKRYKGHITVRNTGAYDGAKRNHPSGLLGQHIDVDCGGCSASNVSLNVSQSSIMSSNCFMSPLSVIGYPSNTTHSYCFSLTVPASTSSIDFLSRVVTREGTKDEAICNATKSVDLPSCICDVCEEWEIIPTKKSFTVIDQPEGKMKISTAFQILNAEPMKFVKAEVNNVKHSVNDEQCYTCTKSADDMGLMWLARQFTPSGWQNSGKGFNAYNKDQKEYFEDLNNKYYNEATWVSETSGGVDFSTGNRTLQLYIDLPDISSLDCCENKYEVCVRYTFTDINCQTCDTVICYEYNTSSTSTGNGGGIGSTNPAEDSNTSVKRRKRKINSTQMINR